MNAAPLRRPLGCLKANLRRTRQQRLLFRRLLATAAEPARPSSAALPEHTFQAIRGKTKGTVRTAFAVYTAPPSPAVAAHPNPLQSLHAAQIRGMDPTGARTALFSKTNADAARVGDVLMVTTRRGAEPFSGVCISIRRRGIDSAILLRGQLSRVGVEMWYKIYSRNVVGIEIIHRRKRRARRARLNYMRQPKHDMGSVEPLVIAWRKSRNVLRTKGAAKAAKVGAKGKGKGAAKKKA